MDYMCAPSLVLIAQVVFLLERGLTNKHTHTQTQTPLITLPTHRLRQAWVITRDSLPCVFKSRCYGLAMLRRCCRPR